MLEKRKALKINLIDYLENHYAPRLETERENALEEGIKKREKYAKELLFDKEPQTENATIPEEKPKADVERIPNNHQDELENLLEEFFA